MENRAAEIRTRIKTNLEAQQRNALELAFDLGVVDQGALWRGWEYAGDDPARKGKRYESLREYLDVEVTRYVSLSYAYQLTRIGAFFRPMRDKIEELVAEKKARMPDLVNLSAAGAQGLPLADAMDHLVGQAPLPEQFQHAERKDPDRFRTVELLIPRGDYDAVMKGLVIYAAIHGLASEAEALRDFAIGVWTNAPREFTDLWDDFVEKGQFRCRRCSNVPRDPVLYLVIPVEIGKGHGPKVVLCRGCLPHVEKAGWKDTAVKWYGKKWFKRNTEHLRHVERSSEDHEGGQRVPPAGADAHVGGACQD